MHTGCTRPAGSSRLASGTPPKVACACVTIVIVQSDRNTARGPKWLPLAACHNAPRVSCMASDPRASRCPWATTVTVSVGNRRDGGTFSAALHVELICRFGTDRPATRARVVHRASKLAVTVKPPTRDANRGAPMADQEPVNLPVLFIPLSGLPVACCLTAFGCPARSRAL
jgi:hypothetical protein